MRGVVTADKRGEEASSLLRVGDGAETRRLGSSSPAASDPASSETAPAPPSTIHSRDGVFADRCPKCKKRVDVEDGKIVEHGNMWMRKKKGPWFGNRCEGSGRYAP